MSSDKFSRERMSFEDGFRILQGEQEYVAYREHSSIRIWPSEEAWHYPRHTHSAVEVVFTQRGNVVIEMTDQTFCVRAGQILLIPSDTPHSLAMEEDSSRLLFLFEPQVILTLRDLSGLGSLWRRPIYLSTESELRSQVASLLMKVTEVYNARQELWNSLCYSYLIQIYSLLGQSYMAKQNTKSNETVGYEFISSAISYIKQNYMKKITLDDVADFAGFSRYYFSRVFKRATGVSFLDYLCRCRIAAAEEQLVHTNHSIQTIAFDCGFTSIATFNRIFREHKKCTPSYFRRIYSEKERNAAGAAGNQSSPASELEVIL